MTTSPGESGYTHERPTLTSEPCKPDIVDRLRMLAIDMPESATVRAGINTVIDAVATIKGLRESDARRLRMVSELKARVAELEAALRRIGTPIECGCSPCTGDCRSDASRAASFDIVQQDARDALAPATRPASADAGDAT